MKTRHILACLALSLLGTGLKAQMHNSIDPALRDVPQVFSPNAAELGKYGKIPVNYFNGLPSISIPITELHAKNYTLPIYLTYHASGNKPDQHPGWVGLGWTLHAGGCINRIVNGLKDEMTTDEYYGLHRDDGTIYVPPSHPGYYHHATSVQQTGWENEQNWYDVNHEDVMMDRDPDEFQICLDDIQASFFFTSGGAIRIVSKSDADFTVEAHMTPNALDPIIIYPGPGQEDGRGRAVRYKSFDRFTITSKDGTRYVFGGDDSAIEYWMPLTPVLYVDQASGNLRNANQWRCIATATSWMLTRIERPDGETITFTYAKDGTPVVRRDVHQGGYELMSHNGQTISYDSFDTKDEPLNMSNLSFSLIQPSYLSSITCSQSQDSLCFARMRTTELNYPTTEGEFNTRAGIYYYDDVLSGQRYYSYERIMSDSYYMQMSGITGPDRDIRFSYSSDSAQRLSLQQVSFRDSDKNQPDHRYVFHYDSETLPPYGARKSDIWGFYNGIYYGNVSTKQMESVRSQVNPLKAQAEILTSIEYPTGGHTEFIYEGHTYSKRLEPLELNLEETGISMLTGGLRIKEIQDYSAEGKPEIRTFSYAGEDGLSSGILAGSPRLYVQGKTLLYYDLRTLPYHPGVDTLAFTGHYHLYSENPLRPLSTTDGNCVTYSRVRELFSDGSYTEYRFSNHDQKPFRDILPDLRYEIVDSLLLVTSFNSRELFRGMLLERKDYSKDGVLVRLEQNTYDRDTTSFMKAISCERACRDLIKSHSCRRILTGYPYLKSRAIRLYPDGGGSPNKETVEYTYDSHRRLTGTTRKVGGARERDTFTYTGNYAVHPYPGMISTNMISYPVEHLTFRKDTLQAEKLVSAELTTWTQSDSLYLPAAKYKGALGSGITPSSFNPYDGNAKDSRYGTLPEVSYMKYDPHGNVILSEDRTGLATSYVWTSDGCHPAAIFTGAKRGYTRYISNDISRVKIYHFDPDDPVSLDFESLAPFTLRIWLMCPNYQCWDLSPVVDGNAHRIVCVNDPQAPNPWPAHASSYPSPLEIPLSAGSHTLRIPVSNHFYVANSPDPAGYTLEINYKEKQTTAQQVSGQTVVFEDFEDETGAQVPAGYNSGKSHRGSWTHSLDTSGGPYVVDYRVYRNGKWNYVRQSASGSSVTISEGTAPIDHVRIYPLGSMPESYTWNDDGTLRSRTDSRGLTESYRYDGLGRLAGVYDNEQKKVEGYQYNYKNRGNE